MGESDFLIFISNSTNHSGNTYDDSDELTNILIVFLAIIIAALAIMCGVLICQSNFRQQVISQMCSSCTVLWAFLTQLCTRDNEEGDDNSRRG